MREMDLLLWSLMTLQALGIRVPGDVSVTAEEDERTSVVIPLVLTSFYPRKGLEGQNDLVC